MIILIFLILLIGMVVGAILTLATENLHTTKEVWDKEWDRLLKGVPVDEYQCEHAKNNTINAGCVWCNLALADKTIEILKEKNNKLLAITDAQVRKIKSLEGELGEENDKLKLYIEELEDDYLKLCKEIGIEEPALYRAIENMLKPKFKKKVKELIKKYNKSKIE